VDLYMVKREKWLEADIDALATEEPESFDRKSGRLFDDQEGSSIPLRRRSRPSQILAVGH